MREPDFVRRLVTVAAAFGHWRTFGERAFWNQDQFDGDAAAEVELEFLFRRADAG